MSYCTKEEVNNLFGDISDDISDEMFATVIANSTAWIDSNLKKSYVPLPSITIEMVDSEGCVTIVSKITSITATYNLINVPDGLRAAAIYYAASDILLSLYHGDELPVQYDVWFNKAQSLLDDYILAYKHTEAEESELAKIQCVKHSKGLTYNQKRRRGYRRW